MPVKCLYRENAYIKEFTATVTSCIPAGEGFVVTLDATAFYPEGGGQPADTGMLGPVRVLDVHERSGDIFHTTNLPLTVGETVLGKLDWQRRFSLMQHHTAEHIVSGLVHKLYKLDNVGFHMGSAMVTVDFNGELNAEQLDAVELLANRVVFSNIAVEEFYPDAETLTSLDYRSKKALSGEVRIITIPEADCCACCGTHVSGTGEIGLIKLLSPQRYKGGVRVGLLCGERALLDYRQKDASVSMVSALLSAKPIEIAEAVQRVLWECDVQKSALAAAKDKLFALRISAIDSGDAPLCLFEDDLAPYELRRFCLMMMDCRPGPCLLLSGDDKNGYRYALGIPGGDARALSKQLHHVLGGKGGGNAQLVQGAFAAERKQIEAFISSIQ